jgi:nucleoside-diphosphate-sugar epimerase
MVSSTRVFAERAGGWVDEESPLTSDDACAEEIIAAEHILRDGPAPCTRVRFAGIYGDPHGHLLNRVARGAICPPQPVRYSNRIHRDDCAGLLAHLLLQAEAGAAPEPVYIGVDDAPVPQYEVERWLCAQLGVEPVEVAATPQRGHRRCTNRALHRSGYRLCYPDYRSGYGAVLAARAAAGG